MSTEESDVVSRLVDLNSFVEYGSPRAKQTALKWVGPGQLMVTISKECLDVLLVNGQEKIGMGVNPSGGEMILFPGHLLKIGRPIKVRRYSNGDGYLKKVVDSQAVSFAFASGAKEAIPSKISSFTYQDRQCVLLVFDQNDQAESSETGQSESCVCDEPSEEVDTAELNDAALTDEVVTHDLTPNEFEDESMNQPENDQLQH